MKKTLIVLLTCLFSLPVWAGTDLEALLNKVILQFSAEQWVTTKSALVNVGVNAAVSDQGLEKIQSEVMQQLSKLAGKGDWHILSFNRSLDKSGLESVQISAQARLDQSDLVNLRGKAKTLSKPGETFTIDDVQFTPSEDEMRQANTSMRNNIYQQVKAEIDVLNKLYPDQKYNLHQINFISAIMPMPMMRTMNAMALEQAPSAPPLDIGNKAQLQATVVLAATPEWLFQKVK